MKKLKFGLVLGLFVLPSLSFAQTVEVADFGPAPRLNDLVVSARKSLTHDALGVCGRVKVFQTDEPVYDTATPAILMDQMGYGPLTDVSVIDLPQKTPVVYRMAAEHPVAQALQNSAPTEPRQIAALRSLEKKFRDLVSGSDDYELMIGTARSRSGQTLRFVTLSTDMNRMLVLTSDSRPREECR